MNEIIAAIITVGITLVCVLLANQKTQAVMEPRIDDLTVLIAEAKASIREQYPDEEGGA